MAFQRLTLVQPRVRTEKLFHKDAFLREAEATVLEIHGKHVVLDRSVFYAESGGQEWDTGTIAGQAVVDVQDQNGDLALGRGTRVPIPAVKVNTIVVHQLDAIPLFSVGDKVRMEIDWNRRWNLMRSHGAAHFVYHACKVVLGTAEEPLFTKGCHISEDRIRFDFAGDYPSDRVPEIQGLANRLLETGSEIRMEQSEVSDEIFYWVCNEILIPCGGTHATNTDDLPKIAVKRSKKGASVTRFTVELQPYRRAIT